MSSSVDFIRLSHELAERRYGYLITLDNDGRAHPIPVMPVLNGETIRISSIGGTKSRANLHRNPMITVLWPPSHPEEFSIIADGTATICDPDEEGLATVTFIPTRAVLIRVPTPDSPTPRRCYSECVDMTIL